MGKGGVGDMSRTIFFSHHDKFFFFFTFDGLNFLGETVFFELERVQLHTGIIVFRLLSELFEIVHDNRVIIELFEVAAV